MTQIFAYISSDDRLTQETFDQHGGPLTSRIDDEDIRLGLGWIQDGRSLFRKNPRSHPGDVDLVRLLSDIPARAFIGALEAPQDSGTSPANLQPFRFRKWVFAAAGGHEALSEQRESMLEELPDFLARNVLGSTDAELLFHLFLQRLPSVAFSAPVVEASLCVEALGQLVRDLEERFGELEQLRMLALTERTLLGVSIGDPIYRKQVRGLTESPERPLFAGHSPKGMEHPRFKALLLGSQVEADGFDALPDRQIFWLDRSWEFGQRDL